MLSVKSDSPIYNYIFIFLQDSTKQHFRCVLPATVYKTGGKPEETIWISPIQWPVDPNNIKHNFTDLNLVIFETKMWIMLPIHDMFWDHISL